MTEIVELRVRGVQELVERLQFLRPQVARRIGRLAMSRAMAPVLASAQSNAMANKRSGALVAALKIRLQTADQIAKSTLALRITGGSTDAVRGTVLPVRKDSRAIALYRLGYQRRKKWKAFSIRHGHLVEFGTKRSKAYPFLEPALRNNAQRVVDILAEELERGIDRAFRRGKNLA